MKIHISFVLFFSLLTAQLLAVTDSTSMRTTVVTHAYSLAKPFLIQKPVMVDKVNVNNKSFSNENLLESFVSLPDNSAYTEEMRADMQDYFHLAKATDKDRFYFISFRLSSEKFSKTNLKVKATSMFEVYINGVKEGSKNTVEDSLSLAKTTKFSFSVLPSFTYDVVIKYLSLTTNKAPEDMKITLESENEKSDVVYTISKVGGKRNITIRDILEGKRVLESRISPKGNYVLLKIGTIRDDGKAYTENFSLSLRDNNKKIELPSDRVYSWFPKSDILYYRSNITGKNQAIAFDPILQEEKVLAKDIPAEVFRFTPDGKQLIFQLKESPKDSKSDLIVLSAPESIQPGNNDRLYISKYDLETGVQQRLTFGNTSTVIRDISQDSRFLLYSVKEYDPTRRPFFFTSLFRLDLATLAVDTLFRKEPFADSFKFSPDGRKILIRGSAETFDGIGNILSSDQIPNSYNKLGFIFDIDSRKIDPFTKNFVPSVEELYWSNADGMIYLQVEDRDFVRVYRYNPTNKQFSMLNLKEEVISSFHLSSGSLKATYFGQSNSNFPKAYLYDLKSDKSTLIADPDQQVIDRLNLPKIEEWSFISKDGTTIDGRYYLPPNFDSSKKYPLIVYYYGGTAPTPRKLISPYPSQVYASLGYVVYVLQPSGAIGYGQKFAAFHVNGWGKENADNVIDGTKKFIAAHPFVNDKKVGCIGASYGGYLTMYLQTQTDLFAAAVSHAGISSIASYWGEGYWGYTYSSVASAESYPWNNPDLYVKQSPLFNAEKVNTPLLLLHGTVDTNVPIGESMQMYTALKILGKPVEFIQIKGENHGIRNFKKRIEWNNSIYAWFAKWLQDDSYWWKSIAK